MSVREQASNLGFNIVGLLSRRADLEYSRHEVIYLDDAGNEYILRRGILTIITADGGVI